ncbi:TAT-variant-translocated molybdopterin oxidoreductase [Granulicella cerasi]|uniref:TAT-variant-translocated molybdopterin oxidoreductase n=1 Tax=Granulicella cerasi TaxID=741063 RepID=A0ABW1ZCD6_9BACT|nr:TAT-variant-translocated molybdopterin oxidoreductase [Granulicella cerasi]
MKNATVVTRIVPANKMTLAEVRTKLEGQRGKRFWKNLDELADTPEFQELMQEEFPRQAGAGEWVDSVSRRGFMKVMGASFALAGLAGCTKQPDEQIFPYVKQPEDLVLGKPMYFASAHPFPTGAVPVLVKSDAFRPIKLEGNPEHPMSKGKSDAYTQASLLDMYDPDRSREVKFRGEGSSFGAFQQAFATAAKQTDGGKGIYFVTETFTSPTLASQWKQVSAKYPNAKLAVYDAALGDATYALDTQYKLEDAEVILSLDADFLGGIAFPGFLPLSAAWAEGHRYEEGKKMSRTYAVETMPSVTGFKADHRIALKPSQIDALAAALAGTGSVSSPEAQKFVTAALADLKKAGSKGVVIAGPQSSPAVQAAAKAINQQIGAVGKTVSYGASTSEVPATALSLSDVVADINAGKVQWLVLMNVNPMYNAPADLEFAAAFSKVPTVVHLGSHLDETGYLATWHLNNTHYLESWTDARAYDGTITIIQPMIAPLYGGVSSHDVFQALLDPSISAYDAVVATAKTYIKGDFATSWKKALHDGWVEGTAGTQTGTAKIATAAKTAPSDLEIRFLTDPSLFDGRYANNGWLQELPKQVTNLSWDNAALMSLETMEKYKLEENNAVELEVAGRKVIAGVLMVPGHAPEAVTVHLGFGRHADAGRVGAGVGFASYYLRTVAGSASAPLKLTKTPDTYDLCVTKVHNIEHRGKFAQQDLEHKQYDTEGTFSLAGHEANERGIIRYATYEEAEKDAQFAHHSLASGLTTVDKVGYNPMGEDPEHSDSFFPDAWRYDRPQPTGDGYQLQYKWGMQIDLNSCVGCNACIVSCYAENNIPVVGRAQVKVGRNMQWLRIDTYFEGDLHAPKAFMQPMTCQHCENAGCEQVCPVGATVHTPEGINTMVYNRCVGTRYCSNNCPYKVRRYNWMLYSDFDTESLKFMRNPDVSVRSRGVMEKCSYCIQRVEAAKIEADKENRMVADGEILTACQQACPTEAITFGNLNDPNSKIAKLKKSERNYAVLADLNFRPRTTYTAGVINPNPELA